MTAPRPKRLPRVALTLSLPITGTGRDYASAITMAITQNAGNGLAQAALGGLLAQMRPPPVMPYFIAEPRQQQGG